MKLRIINTFLLVFSGLIIPYASSKSTFQLGNIPELDDSFAIQSPESNIAKYPQYSNSFNTFQNNILRYYINKNWDTTIQLDDKYKIIPIVLKSVRSIDQGDKTNIIEGEFTGDTDAYKINTLNNNNLDTNILKYSFQCLLNFFTSTEKYCFGASIGLNNPKIFAKEFDNLSAFVGLSLGLNLIYKYDQQINLFNSLTLGNKGANISLNEKEGKIRITYLTLTSLLDYSFYKINDISLQAQFGPSIAINCSASYEFNNITRTISDVKTFDYGLALGITAFSKEYYAPIKVGINYYYGLPSIQAGSNTLSLNNGVFSFYIAIFYNNSLKFQF